MPYVLSVPLLGFEVSVDMRTIQCSHPRLVALARSFWCLPVLDELPSGRIVSKHRPPGRRKFNVGSETGAGTRYLCDRKSLYVRQRFLFDAIRGDIELQWHGRTALH